MSDVIASVDAGTTTRARTAEMMTDSSIVSFPVTGTGRLDLKVVELGGVEPPSETFRPNAFYNNFPWGFNLSS